MRLLRNAEGAGSRSHRPAPGAGAPLQKPCAPVWMTSSPLSGLAAGSGRRSGGGARWATPAWQAESGQFLLDLSAPGAAAGPDTPGFPHSSAAGRRRRGTNLDGRPFRPSSFNELACEQEESDPQQARETYLQLLALVSDPTPTPTSTWGRLLHQRGRSEGPPSFTIEARLATRPRRLDRRVQSGRGPGKTKATSTAAIEAYEKIR